MTATEQRFVLGIAYPALRKDGHGDFARPDTVERMAWEYLRSGRQIGVLHADGTVGHADVVESYIHRGDSYTVTGPDGVDVTVNPGDWLLGAIFDEQLWALYKAGKLDGWSIDGFARRRKAVPA